MSNFDTLSIANVETFIRIFFINTIKWSRQGDNNTGHLIPSAVPCPSHAAPIATGSPTVFVNGKGAGRVGDSVAGCTSVAAGSPNTFCGP